MIERPWYLNPDERFVEGDVAQMAGQRPSWWQQPGTRRDALAVFVADAVEHGGEDVETAVLGALVDAQVLKAHTDTRCNTHGGNQPGQMCNEGCDIVRVVTHYTRRQS